MWIGGGVFGRPEPRHESLPKFATESRSRAKYRCVRARIGLTEEAGTMASSGWTQYSENQIREILELARMGMQPADLARRYNVPVVVIHVWQTKYGDSGGESDRGRLRRLEEDISKLNQLVGELTVEYHQLREKVGRKG